MGWFNIVSDNDLSNLISGDEPVEIMSIAIEEIINIYQKKFNRPPHKEELEFAFQFSIPDDIS